MAEESTEEFKAKLKEDSERLFALLSKKELSAEDKQQADAIIGANPQILGWKDFTEKVALPDLMTEHKKETDISKLINRSEQALQTTRQVLDNLQQMKKEGMLASVKNPAADVIDTGIAPNGETIATQTVKNINFLESLKTLPEKAEEQALVAGYNKEYKEFLTKMYKDENSYGANSQSRNLKGESTKDILKNISADRNPVQVESLRQNNPQNHLSTTRTEEKQAMPQKTLSIEELKDKAYQGTLTVEQANQLRKHDDDKKIADMKNQDGDAKKNRHEPSKDKFRDEDVIKYMYEDWFLGGASWLFNTVEAGALGLIDSACEKARERAAKYRQEKEDKKEKKLNESHTRANNFQQMTGNMMDGLGAQCQAKAESYNALMQELRDNLGNPNPNWQHFDPNDPFIQRLEANPAQARKFIDKTSQELQNRTKMIETTGKLAMLITSTEMVDEFMKNHKTWNNKNNQPASNEELQEMFMQRYQETQGNILQALTVMAEDNRIMSEAIHNTMPDPKPDLETFTQQRLTQQQNDFLKQLAEKTKEASSVQQEDLNNNRFNDFSDENASSKTRSKLNQIHKMIDGKIKDGNLYDKEIFSVEHSRERINAKAGLYEEAMKENSPQSMQKIFEYAKELNGYQHETLESRRLDAAARRNTVEKYKNQIISRNQNPLTKMFGKMGNNQR